jgi:hypothetical protein
VFKGEKQTFSKTKRKFGVATQLDFPFLILLLEFEKKDN